MASAGGGWLATRFRMKLTARHGVEIEPVGPIDSHFGSRLSRYRTILTAVGDHHASLRIHLTS